MSAEEFGEWQAMFTREQLHPAAERMRHAQLLAAIHNGELRKHDKSLWSASQFIDLEPWRFAEQESEPVQPTAQQLAAQVASINARFES
jgi:hypothetical protein